MSRRNAIRLIEPRSGAVTRPLQKYELIAHVDKRGRHIRPSDKADWWRPVDRDGVVSLDNDKSRPSPVRFTWTTKSGAGACDLLISRNRDFRDPLVVRGVIGGHCEVFHLHVGTRYYWRSKDSGEFQGLLSALRPFGRGRNDIQGQVEGYLRAIGVTAREIAAIRALLTEPRGSDKMELNKGAT